MGSLDPGKDGEKVDELLEQLRGLAALGVTHFHGQVPDVQTIRPLEILGAQVIPEALKF